MKFKGALLKRYPFATLTRTPPPSPGFFRASFSCFLGERIQIAFFPPAPALPKTKRTPMLRPINPLGKRSLSLSPCAHFRRQNLFPFSVAPALEPNNFQGMLYSFLESALLPSVIALLRSPSPFSFRSTPNSEPPSPGL